MIKKQIWRPDSCGCEVEQSFDYSVEPTVLVSTDVLRACPEHSDKDYQKILKKNKDKNKPTNE